MNYNNNNGFSSFWFDENEGNRVNDVLGIEEKQGVDLIKLASLRRAISNFVTIVTGQDIPVTFKTSGKDSFTDGKKIQIGSSLKEGDFDWTVGLALHEGSHIILSDFSLLKNLEMNVPQELFMRAENMGISRMELLKNIKNVLNYVEDRRIDNFIFKSAPGYKGYYHAMYDKFFYTKVIDKGLMSSEKCEESWDSYMFRIINLHNTNTRLGALKGLKEISRTIGLGSISRLENSQDALDVSLKVISIILDNIVIEKPETENQEGSQSQSGDSSESGESGEGSGSSDEPTTITDEELQEAIDNGSLEEGSDSDSDKDTQLVELSDNQKKMLDNAIKKQEKFLNGDIQKKRVTKKDLKSLESVEQSGMRIEKVGEDYKDDYSYYTRKSNSTECIVIDNLTQGLIDSGEIHMLSNYRSEENQENINRGIVLGKKLGRKLQVRNESRMTTFTRKNSGKIDKRLLSELGFGNTDVFQQTFVDSYSDALLWISIDASGSMGGKKWNRTMTSVTAIAKAASMTQNLDVVIDFRSSYSQGYGRGNDCKPLLLIAYDSRKDKFSKIQRLFQSIHPSGITPEGLCFEAIMDKLVPSSKDRDSYFLNFSDGQPYFSNSDIDYSGRGASIHTKKMVDKIREKGISVLSYFIKDSYGGSIGDFTTMYGKDAKDIDVTNVMSVAKTMNQRFLQK